MKMLREVFNTFASLFKGLKVTLLNWSWLRPSVTELYPEERPKLSERYRGMPSLPVDPKTGKSPCIGCGACARACPENIIDVVQDKTDPKNRKPEHFRIDMSRCMFCGLCEEACPIKCLKLSKEFELSCRSREDMIYDIEKLQEMGGVLPEKPEKPAPAPKPAAEGHTSPPPPSKGESEEPSPQPCSSVGEGEEAPKEGESQ